LIELEQIREQIRVLVVDDVAETRENLRKLLSFAADIEVVGAAASGEEGVEMVSQCEPHIVLMDINMPGMDGIAATEAILQESPATQVVILSVQGESDYLRRAMLAGARDFLTKPPSGDELMSTIRQVYETGKRLSAVMTPAQAISTTMAPVEGRASQRRGDVIALFSPKGGVGCTTIAVNLAIALQRRVGTTEKVALVDTNFQFGDVGVMLNMSANRSIADLADQIEDLDSDMLSSVMSPHGSGIKVLLAPPHPEAAENLLTDASQDGRVGGTSAFKAILELARQEFDIIVVDMPSQVDDMALTVFDVAAVIVLVVAPNIPCIKSARLFLEVANKLNYVVEEIALVVNGVDRRSGIRVEQIEQALIPVAAQIPLDEQVTAEAANRGTPFIIRDQNRPVSQGVIQLAEHVDGLIAQKQEADGEGEMDESMVPGTGRLRLGRLFH
jgi:pilus assembly protein CpaE